MREIKFKFWDVPNKVMLAEPELDLYDGCINFWLKHQNTYIILQYIRLKDKNGKEIFEGDIVQWLGFEVRNINGKYVQLRPIRQYEITCEINNWVKTQNIIFNNGILEIIGNIYENPEILKEEQG